MNSSSHTTLDSLRAAVRGRVWTSNDADFHHVRRPWNLAINQHPCAVVEAADAEDIARLVRFARDAGISVATQPSGHGATGRASGAILLRTTNLAAIEIDPESRIARVGAGVCSGDLQRAASAHGLTALPGSSPVVSVTGAALGGGLSWFGRAFGWMSDGIVSADIVDAEGRPRRIDPQSDPELFWALGGGAGELAIVTALRLRLHPAPAVYGGRQLWSAAHAPEVAATYRSLTALAPPQLTLWLEFLHFPGSEPMIAIDSTFLGRAGDARELMSATENLPAPLAERRAAISAADLGMITGEPTDPSLGLSRCELLAGLDEDALALLTSKPMSPLMTVQLRHLSGALAEPSGGPHGPLREPFLIYMFGVPSSPEAVRAIARKQSDLAAALPSSGRKPMSFLSPTEGIADALPESSVRRLRRLKKDRDPRAIIQGNFAI